MATPLFPRRTGSRSLAGLQRGFGGGWKGPSAAWGAERPPNPAGSLSAPEEEEKEEAEPARRDARRSGRRGEGSGLIASPCLPGVILSDLGRRISVPLGSGCHSPGGADRSRLEGLSRDRAGGSHLASIGAGKRGFGIWKGAGRAGTAARGHLQPLGARRFLFSLSFPNARGTGSAAQELSQEPGGGSGRRFSGLMVQILLPLSIFPAKSPSQARRFLSWLLPPAIIPRNLHLMIRLGLDVGKRCHAGVDQQRREGEKGDGGRGGTGTQVAAACGAPVGSSPAAKTGATSTPPPSPLLPGACQQGRAHH